MQSLITWKEDVASSVASGRWSNSGGGRNSMAEAFLESFGAIGRSFSSSVSLSSDSGLLLCSGFRGGVGLRVLAAVSCGSDLIVSDFSEGCG